MARTQLFPPWSDPISLMTLGLYGVTPFAAGEPRATFIAQGSAGQGGESWIAYPVGDTSAFILSTEASILFGVSVGDWFTAAGQAPETILNATVTVYAVPVGGPPMDVTSLVVQGQETAPDGVQLLLGNATPGYSYMLWCNFNTDAGSTVSLQCDLIECPA